MIGFPIALMHWAAMDYQNNRMSYKTGHDDGWSQGWDDCKEEIDQKLEEQIDGSDVHDKTVNAHLAATIKLIRDDE